MKNFPVPPEYCIILKVMNDTSSLREAAKTLNTDPGALARKIQKISSAFGLIHKTSSRWTLSEEGKRLVQWVDESIAIQKTLLSQKPTYRVGTFTWLQETVLIPNSDDLRLEIFQKYKWIYKIASKNLDSDILASRVDFIIACDPPYDPSIAHRQISTEKWIIAVPFEWEKNLRGLPRQEALTYLSSKPFLKREHFKIENEYGLEIKTISSLTFEGIIGLRTAIENGIGWGILPSNSTKSELLKKPIYTLDILPQEMGGIFIWWLRSRKDLTNVSTELRAWLMSKCRPAIKIDIIKN